MAGRNNQPVPGGFAAVFALAVLAAAPVLAAPDRSICEDGAASTLDFTAAEFSGSAATGEDEAIEFPGANFELASRESVVDEDDEQEPTERSLEDDAETDQSDTAVPVDAGPLVYKRQMYRRDI